MELLQCVLWLAIIPGGAFGAVRHLEIIQENIIGEITDHSMIQHLEGNVYEYNNTATALNFTMTLYKPFPENSKIDATAFKFMKGDYRLGLIHITKTLKDALAMDAFDMSNLFQMYSRPPLVWPTMGNVSYRLVGWNPRGSNFPPTIPAGKWKVPIVLLHPDKTQMGVITWYLTLVYKN